MALQKDIRTFHMQNSVVGVAGESNNYNAWMTKLVQDKIRIVGVAIIAEAIPLAELDSGELSFEVEISRVGAINQDGLIALCIGYVFGVSVTVAAASSEVAVGHLHKDKVIFFPEGHGVDLDPGDAIYMNATFGNTMANNHSFAGIATIYYVER